MSKPKEIAQKFVNDVSELGWNVDYVRGTVICITKRFTAGSKEEFVKADQEYYGLLGQIPKTTAGSIWGTDGGGIGAVSACDHGRMEMKMSGCSKRVLKWIEKLK